LRASAPARGSQRHVFGSVSPCSTWRPTSKNHRGAPKPGCTGLAAARQTRWPGLGLATSPNGCNWQAANAAFRRGLTLASDVPTGFRAARHLPTAPGARHTVPRPLPTPRVWVGPAGQRRCATRGLARRRRGQSTLCPTSKDQHSRQPCHGLLKLCRSTRHTHALQRAESGASRKGPLRFCARRGHYGSAHVDKLALPCATVAVTAQRCLWNGLDPRGRKPLGRVRPLLHATHGWVWPTATPWALLACTLQVVLQPRAEGTCTLPRFGHSSGSLGG
jgi:hypothetical protein